MLEVLGRFGTFLNDLGAILRLLKKKFRQGCISQNASKTKCFSMFFESPIMRASGRHDIPRGLHIPKSFKNHWFFLGFLKVTKQGVVFVPGHVPRMFRAMPDPGGEGVFINKE